MLHAELCELAAQDKQNRRPQPRNPVAQIKINIRDNEQHSGIRKQRPEHISGDRIHNNRRRQKNAKAEHSLFGDFKRYLHFSRTNFLM